MTQARDNTVVRGGSAKSPIRIFMMLATTVALLASSGLLIAAVAAEKDPALWIAGFAAGAAGIALSLLTTTFSTRT